MVEALDGVKANVKTPYTLEVLKQCEGVLLPIEKGSTGGGNALQDWVKTHEPPVKSLFKSGDDSTVKPTPEK